MNPSSHYETLARSMCPIYSFIDLRVESIKNGLYRASIPLSANVQNHLKIFHAGPIWMAAEFLGGLLVLDNVDATRHQPVVAGLKIEFMRPALSDIIAETKFSNEQVDAMRRSLDTAGRFDFTTHIVVRDANTTIVAEAEGKYTVKDFSHLLSGG
jgi:acyl-coenzyme A thioesterase PaaI-like protein